jgi:hypothetical protein
LVFFDVLKCVSDRSLTSGWGFAYDYRILLEPSRTKLKVSLELLRTKLIRLEALRVRSGSRQNRQLPILLKLHKIKRRMRRQLPAALCSR